MKALLFVTTAPLICFTAFAQGHAGFANDGTHLVYYQSVPGHADGDPVWAGNSNIGDQTYNFMADLYMGTSSGALSLVSSATFSSISPGHWNIVHAVTPFLTGTIVFTIVQVRDVSQTPPSIWTPLTLLSGPYGRSDEFQFTIGPTTPIFPLITSQGLTPTTGGPGTGNWAPGTENMDSTGVGLRGAIPVTIPEPSRFALILLCVGTLRLLWSRTLRS